MYGLYRESTSSFGRAWSCATEDGGAELVIRPLSKRKEWQAERVEEYLDTADVQRYIRVLTRSHAVTRQKMRLWGDQSDNLKLVIRRGS